MIEAGKVVQLKSGGARLTVSGTRFVGTTEVVYCMYYNEISGAFEKLEINATMLREINLTRVPVVSQPMGD